MQSKNQPTAEQKRFRENLRDLYPHCEIHHAVGSSAKIKGVGNIGHWFVLALSQNHDEFIKGLGKGRKAFEKSEYKVQMERYFHEYFQMPVPDDVLEAIRNYSI